jgi:hypothetical protein
MTSLGAIAEIADAKLKGDSYANYLENALRSGNVDDIRGFIDHGGFDSSLCVYLTYSQRKNT